MVHESYSGLSRKRRKDPEYDNMARRKCPLVLIIGYSVEKWS